MMDGDLLKLYMYENKDYKATSIQYFYRTYIKKSFMTTPSNWLSTNHEISMT